MQSGWDEKLAGSFWGVFPQNGRFNFPKTVLVHEISDSLCEAMTQFQDVPHPLAPQVQIAILEPNPFVNRNVIGDGERQRFSVVEDFQRFRVDFNFAGRQLRVLSPRRSSDNFARNFEHPFVSDFPCSGNHFRWAKLGVKDALDDTASVPQVNEDNSAVITNPVDPSAQSDGLTDVSLPQLATVVGLQHIRFTFPFGSFSSSVLSFRLNRQNFDTTNRLKMPAKTTKLRRCECEWAWIQC